MTIADKKFLGALLLHCADLSNCCQPWALSDKWAQRVHKEFSAQAANEQRRGLPVVQFMLSATDEQWARTECDFIDYVAAPLWNNAYAFMMRHYEKLEETAEAEEQQDGNGKSPPVSPRDKKVGSHLEPLSPTRRRSTRKDYDGSTMARAASERFFKTMIANCTNNRAKLALIAEEGSRPGSAQKKPRGESKKAE